MLRPHDFDVTDEAGETRHPDQILEAVQDLIEQEPDHPIWNATFHLRYWEDPSNRIRVRKHQMMQMARYAHQSVFQWGDVDLVEFREWYDTFVSIVTDEHPQQTQMENSR